eukprot:364789-Chlamydomonas_euryale.AAC.11
MGPGAEDAAAPGGKLCSKLACVLRYASIPRWLRGRAWQRSAVRKNDVAHAFVHIGNIPYDVTESELKEVFGEIGPVKSIRCVHAPYIQAVVQRWGRPTSRYGPDLATLTADRDKDTGRPKGYAFCEFYDRATAESCVRNLNSVEVSGRSLRVDYAEDHSTGRPGPADRDRDRDRDGPRGGDRGGRFDRGTRNAALHAIQGCMIPFFPHCMGVPRHA